MEGMLALEALEMGEHEALGKVGIDEKVRVNEGAQELAEKLGRDH